MDSGAVKRRGWGLWFLVKAFLVTLVQEERPPDRIQDAETNTDGFLSKGLLPAKLPSVTDIKKKIPRRCFEPTILNSMSYILVDAMAIVILYIIAEYLHQLLPLWLFILTTPVYWLLQGTAFTTAFVIGHDCGHGSFSVYDWLNDIVGTIMHAFLFVPYYPWKLSHRHHHKHTGNIDKDEVFYPVRKSHDNGRKALPGFGLGLGWFVYLILGYKPRAVAHLNPVDPMFRNHLIGCVCSLTALAIWSMCIFWAIQEMGLGHILYHYVAPLFVFGSWTVILTFLHHTDENVPWYSNESWDFVRGQLSSIDRDYGWAHSLTLNIGTHQIHHLFSKVPHYHLQEATQHFRIHFPDLVRYKTERIIPTFIKMFGKYAKQVIISDETSVHMYT